VGYAASFVLVSQLTAALGCGLLLLLQGSQEGDDDDEEEEEEEEEEEAEEEGADEAEEGGEGPPPPPAAGPTVLTKGVRGLLQQMAETFRQEQRGVLELAALCCVGALCGALLSSPLLMCTL